MIRIKCPNNKNTPLEDSFKGSLHATLYVFLYLSLLFNARIFPKAFNYWVHNVKVSKIVLRTIMLVVIVICCYIPYFIASDSSFTIKILIAIFLTNVLVGLIGIPLGDFFSEKFGLISINIKVSNIITKYEAHS